jgi:membrane associated rhomboid family serine protease
MMETAMPRSTMPISFPPFSGIVRKLVFANVGIFFAILLLQLFVPALTRTVLDHLVLVPSLVAHGEIWQLVTYAFLHFGILDILFTTLALWFCGSLLEGAYGSRWLRELYFTSAIGGAILASIISFTRILHMSPDSSGSGAWAGIFGVLIAIAVRMGETEFMLFPLPFTIRAKYMVGIYILIAVALVLRDQGAFAALLQLSGAFSGYLFLRFAPRRGVAFGVTEQFFGIRNAWYRNKRRRAARKFEVYMGKQGRQVRFDDEGRYIDPDEERKNPKDKRWMN